jgi:hypothetical protein
VVSVHARDATEREIVFACQSCGDVEIDTDGLTKNVNVEEAQGGGSGAKFLSLLPLQLGFISNDGPTGTQMKVGDSKRREKINLGISLLVYDMVSHWLYAV